MALASTMQRTASGRQSLQRRMSLEASGIRDDKENGPITRSKAALAQDPSNNCVRLADKKNTEHLRSTVDGKTNSGPENESRPFAFDDFALGRQLGEGLFGRVYLARTKKEMKVVALKVLYKNTLEKENVVEQLRREVEIHTRLRHQNIVRMYSYFHDKDRVFLVMEYCPGGTLFDALKSMPNKRFDEPYAANVMKQLCAALSYCHRYQIVHRDIKPENILIGRKGEMKLADFGWAVANHSKDQKMRRKTLCGTVDYLAPEMVDDKTYDERVDAWMVGVLLFEMLVGCPPFTGAHDCETWDKILTSDVAVPSFVSANATDLIRKLLAKDPDDRYDVESVARHPWIREHGMDEMV